MIREEAEALFGIVEEETGITKEDILSKCRKRPIINAKRIMAITLDGNNYKPCEIGRLIGVHRTNLYHYIKTHDTFCDKEEEFKVMFNNINSRFSIMLGTGLPVEIRLKYKVEERNKLNREISKLRKLVNMKNS